MAKFPVTTQFWPALTPDAHAWHAVSELGQQVPTVKLPSMCSPLAGHCWEDAHESVPGEGTPGPTAFGTFTVMLERDRLKVLSAFPPHQLLPPEETPSV